MKVLSDSLAWIAGDNGALLATGRNGVTAIEEDEQYSTTTTPPLGFELYQNYPNPANPSREIRFRISEVSHVTLKVYDLLGREVATLVDEVRDAGQYNYRFSTNGVELSTGVYLYRLSVNGKSAVKKLILLK